MVDLQVILREVKTIPPLSQQALRLLDIIQQGDHSLVDITRIVETDAGLTANVLKIVNAPAFGLGQPVSSLTRALNFLGDKMIVGIAIASSSPKVYHQELSGYVAEAGELWSHSLRTAIASREIAKLAVQPLSPESAYTSGILHDIGKAVISPYIADRTREMLAMLDENKSDDFLDAERKIIGHDHTEIGAALAQHWRLPHDLCQAIRHHHEPEHADERLVPLASAVHLGDLIAMMGGTGTGADTLHYPLAESALSHFNLEPGRLEMIMLTVNDEFTKINTDFFS